MGYTLRPGGEKTGLEGESHCLLTLYHLGPTPKPRARGLPITVLTFY